jgi:hypothetical protein
MVKHCKRLIISTNVLLPDIMKCRYNKWSNTFIGFSQPPDCPAHNHHHTDYVVLAPRKLIGMKALAIAGHLIWEIQVKKKLTKLLVK